MASMSCFNMFQVLGIQENISARQKAPSESDRQVQQKKTELGEVFTFGEGSSCEPLGKPDQKNCDSRETQVRGLFLVQPTRMFTSTQRNITCVIAGGCSGLRFLV